ncbi:SAM-dependent RNA methyltransferase [Suillus clintonianus]|uniref:SAM-dependent RNA methyltransferase n=1 Tax=Suillus clintonianus TaxID=1904413 RepID=UPI001B8809FE|nr:SAM-dependent RNA methyltransferase [Suillus clintonianus]KAG2128279.1 SAM-dependent RNA methyltransferase [Suillus clintonianus]
MTFTYVIEHMEEDESTPKSLPPWVELEYAHMMMLAGINGRVEFTHLSHNSSSSLDARLASTNQPAASYKVHTQSVMELLAQKNIPITRVCLLDPKAQTVLAPEDGKIFDHFLFGGILGDDPPRDRTSELRQLGFPSRHLGQMQMTTDTALGVTKRVVDDKVQLNAIPYVDFPTIVFNAKESVEMPFRYIVNGKEPILPPGMRELLHEDLDKSFDF